MEIKLSDLTKKVEKSISEYIEFDVNEIFNSSDYITIYGGAVRDSLAGLEIHDVDILCMANSARKLDAFLLTKGYSHLDLYDLDAINMYKDISVIEEPWTLKNKNGKIIQIIRPLVKSYLESYKNLIKNVDISCCGVFLEKEPPFCELKLGESCKNAIINCLTKTFEINEWGQLYNKNRIYKRTSKLNSRGWMNLDNNKANIFPWEENEYKIKLIRKSRQIKLCKLNFKPEYDYKIWSEDEYLNRKYKDDKKNLNFDIDETLL
jgi:hypothetical protein